MKKYRIYLYRGADGWRWRLDVRNGKVVGASTEAYKRRIDAEKNLASVVGVPVRTLECENGIGSFICDLGKRVVS